MNELREKERLREEYQTYTKECRRKWQYQMTYEQWLAHQLINARAEIARLNNNGADTLQSRIQEQQTSEATQEAWLRERLKLLRFPDAEDVYVAKDRCYFYVTFAGLLTGVQIMMAKAAINATIEHTNVFKNSRNRYRIIFETPDREEM